MGRGSGGGEGGAPVGGGQVAGVLGEDPAVVVTVEGSVLAFAVGGFVEVFPDDGLLALGLVVVGFDVGDEDVRYWVQVLRLMGLSV